MQILTRAFPHCAQKLLSGGLFVPHFEQRISSPERQAIRTSFITLPGSQPLPARV